MSVFWNGRRIGKPAAPIGTTSVRKDGSIFKKTRTGWEYSGVAKPEKTKVVKKRKRSRFR
jgi:hypothetical protein